MILQKTHIAYPINRIWAQTQVRIITPAKIVCSIVICKRTEQIMIRYYYDSEYDAEYE